MKEVEKLSVLLRQIGITQEKCHIIMSKVIAIINGSNKTKTDNCYMCPKCKSWKAKNSIMCAICRNKVLEEARKKKLKKRSNKN